MNVANILELFQYNEKPAKEKHQKIHKNNRTKTGIWIPNFEFKSYEYMLACFKKEILALYNICLKNGYLE